MNMRLKSYMKITRSFAYDIIYEARWAISKKKNMQNCLCYENSREEIIVSLTTFPGRIKIVHKTIKSILNQKSVKPNKVLLWLAHEQFPNKESDLPVSLRSLVPYGLEICWCNDLRSYKKLIPTLREYPDRVIVTADDDVYYPPQWLEKLYQEHCENPELICCHRATKFKYINEKFTSLGGGRHYYKEPSYLNKLVGIGGVLYPLDALHKDVLMEEIFKTYAPTNDDIWFWFMAVKAGTRIKVVKHPYARPVDVLGSAKTDSLTSINDQGDKLFWKDFDRLVSVYPEVKDSLIAEYNHVKME